MKTPARPLDPTLLAQIDEAIEPDPPDPQDAAMHDRVKRQLLRRIAADSTDRHVTHHPGPQDWQPFGDGVQIKVLHEADGIMSYLLRLQAGASLPAHRHPVDEECVVLEGEVQIGGLNLAAGGFHLGRKDLLHDRLSSVGGALIYLRGATPEAALAL